MAGAANMKNLIMSTRICILKEKVLTEPRYVSIEQAKIITDTYKANEGKPRILTRALALKAALEQMEIHAEPEELVVGNRTEGVRQGVVFPESGISWIDQEFESLPGRAQDPFQVRQEDIAYFREVIKPYWKEKSLEDVLRQRCGSEIDHIAKVVKINQKDHAQGHICPDCSKWLHKGPAGIRQEADQCLKTAVGEQKIFYESVSIVMTGAIHFMGRYQMLLEQMAQGLNIVPVAISYEFDPCDFLKAKEFQMKRDDPDYVKCQRDDLLSMETGILNNKGRVHFTITSPINDSLAKLDKDMEKNELVSAIASVIDREIYKNYRFYPCNYVAYDWLNGTRRFHEHYGPKDKKQFEEYIQGQLDKIVLPNKDEAFLRKKLLEMYSNPLKNYLTTL